MWIEILERAGLGRPARLGDARLGQAGRDAGNGTEAGADQGRVAPQASPVELLLGQELLGRPAGAVAEAGADQPAGERRGHRVRPAQGVADGFLGPRQRREEGTALDQHPGIALRRVGRDDHAGDEDGPPGGLLVRALDVNASGGRVPPGEVSRVAHGFDRLQLQGERARDLDQPDDVVRHPAPGVEVMRVHDDPGTTVQRNE
jgi:hypothetical protein